MCGPCEGQCWEFERGEALDGEAEYNASLAAAAQAEAENEALRQEAEASEG